MAPWKNRNVPYFLAPVFYRYFASQPCTSP
jgi:hypothetical protein